MADEDLVRVLQSQRISPQEMQNFSFDTEFGLLISELAAYSVDSDSIKRVACNEQGHLKVAVTGLDLTGLANELSSSTWLHADALTVASGSPVTILSHTVVGTTLYLDEIITTGETDAEYTVVINSVIKLRYRTSEQDRTMEFKLPVSQLLSVGTTIDIKVQHEYGFTADFAATLLAHRP